MCQLHNDSRAVSMSLQDFWTKLRGRGMGESCASTSTMFLSNERERGAYRYRLPTSAEWEFAVRAGSRGDTYAGDLTEELGNDPVVDRIAW